MTPIQIGVALLVLALLGVVLYREYRLKEKDRVLAEKKIALLLSQIQPHFLYNILGSIEWLCETDPKKAQEATEQLSRFLRGNMDSLQSVTTIPAARELEHIRCYLSLEGIRFGEKLHTVYDIETEDFFVPALGLQPLVENAVRHGVTKREAPSASVPARPSGPIWWSLRTTAWALTPLPPRRAATWGLRTSAAAWKPSAGGA